MGSPRRAWGIPCPRAGRCRHFAREGDFSGRLTHHGHPAPLEMIFDARQTRMVVVANARIRVVDCGHRDCRGGVLSRPRSDRRAQRAGRPRSGCQVRIPRFRRRPRAAHGPGAHCSGGAGHQNCRVLNLCLAARGDRGCSLLAVEPPQPQTGSWQTHACNCVQGDGRRWYSRALYPLRLHAPAARPVVGRKGLRGHRRRPAFAHVSVARRHRLAARQPRLPSRSRLLRGRHHRSSFRDLAGERLRPDRGAGAGNRTRSGSRGFGIRPSAGAIS